MNSVPQLFLCAYLIYIKVEILRISPIIWIFYSIVLRFLSTYVYTPSGREERFLRQIPSPGLWYLGIIE